MAKRKKLRGRAKAHHTIVHNYLQCRSDIENGVPTNRSSEEPPNLKNAVIYEIPEGLYRSVYRAADYYTATELAGMPWYDVDRDQPPEEVKARVRHYWETLKTEGHKVPYPNRFPFDSCYFGFYPLPMLAPQDMVTYDIHYDYAFKCGMLVTRSGQAWTFIMATNSPTLVDYFKFGLDIDSMEKALEEKCVLIVVPDCTDFKWNHPLTLAPWIISALMEWVDDHKTVTVEEVDRTVGFKRMWEHANKLHQVHKPVPPHYYAVVMHDQVIFNNALKKRFGQRSLDIKWSHRWLVSGHSRIRVKRGLLPMDPTVEAKLRRPRRGGTGYQIFKDAHPKGDLAQALWRRGIRPKQDNEWMAILVSRIEDHVKGPQNKPLIPSTRRSGRNRPFTP